MKTLKIISVAVLFGSVMAMSSAIFADDGERHNGRFTGPTVFVTSQGLYYDSIVLTDLPMNGDFQLLDTKDGLSTEFGPGDEGYLGGRWWIDVNGDMEMDADDKFFMCPLLGPGRDTF